MLLTYVGILIVVILVPEKAHSPIVCTDLVYIIEKLTIVLFSIAMYVCM